MILLPSLLIYHLVFNSRDLRGQRAVTVAISQNALQKTEHENMVSMMGGLYRTFEIYNCFILNNKVCLIQNL